jgi:HD superfamily phosphodiesterase
MQELYNYAANHLENYDGSHDILHAERVAHNVTKISSQEIFLSSIAGFFHDVCDSKYVNKKESSRQLCFFLKKFYSTQDVKLMIDAIMNVSYTKLKKEGIPKVSPRTLTIWRNVSDADMIEAMGITGCIRTLMYQGKKESNIEDALNYIKTDLVNCHNYMASQVAIRESLLRKKSMERFVYEAECSDDISAIAYEIMLDGHRMISFEEVIEDRIIKNGIDWMIDELRREFSF